MPAALSSDSTPSPAEVCPSARIGATVFRWRGWLPIPIVLLALLVPGDTGAPHWIAGALLIAAGEAIRLAGVAAAGTVTRRRTRDVHRLVTYGIFGWVRNPLYVGNLLLWLGFAAFSGVLWLPPVVLLVFGVEYSFIIAYEEGVLESTFGDEYLAYKRTTSRWLPSPPRTPARGAHDWREAWRSETSTFLQFGTLVIVFAAKQLWLNGQL